MISGAVDAPPWSPYDVFTAAKTRPCASSTSDLRLMWSSATPVPCNGVSTVQAVYGAPSTCTAKWNAELCWSDHMMPMEWLKDTTLEMSSEPMLLSGAGTGAGAVHVASDVVLCRKNTVLLRVKVTHRIPFE